MCPGEKKKGRSPVCTSITHREGLYSVVVVFGKFANAVFKLAAQALVSIGKVISNEPSSSFLTLKLLVSFFATDF